MGLSSCSGFFDETYDSRFRLMGPEAIMVSFFGAADSRRVW
jgi:hypothetical protein